MATPHIEAKKGDFTSTVIMAGDPLRVKFISENYLTDCQLITDVRGMLGYTGYYKNKKISIMSHGMGLGSAGIYFYELFKFYDVDTIIRIGSCGSYQKDINLYDIILVNGSYSDSNYAKIQSGEPSNILYSSSIINKKITNCANNNNNKKLISGNVYSTDVFYSNNRNIDEIINKYKCIAIEMESFALFQTAKLLNKKASCILTVSDNIKTNEKISSDEREKSFTKTIELALNSII